MVVRTLTLKLRFSIVRDCKYCKELCIIIFEIQFVQNFETHTTLGLILRSSAMAEVPSVAVDIAPVHSLVARVMEAVGEPNLIIPASASPHEYSLRPSEAKSLQNADMVFWEDQELTPWLEKSIDTLSQDA